LQGEGRVSIGAEVLTDLPAEDLATIAPKIRNGDLLFCSADDPFSRLIGWSTKSPWTHVGIAWRWHSVDRIVALECVQKIGVHSVALERFISQTSTGQRPYPGKIVLARHADIEARGDLLPLIRYAIDAMGDPFSPAEIAKIGMRIAFARTGREMPEPLKAKDEFICSEYVDRCYRKVDVEIPWDGKGFIAPADIANDPKVTAVARFQTR
jgi:hypothetical protein